MEWSVAVIRTNSCICSTKIARVLWSKSYQPKCSTTWSCFGKYVCTILDKYSWHNDTISRTKLHWCNTWNAWTRLYSTNYVPNSWRVFPFHQYDCITNWFLARIYIRKTITWPSIAMPTISVGFLQPKYISVLYRNTRSNDSYKNFKCFSFFFLSIKMCTNVNHKDLITVHHEMLHVQYFLNYRHQPKVFRDGANSGENNISLKIIFNFYFLQHWIWNFLRELFLCTIVLKFSRHAY